MTRRLNLTNKNSGEIYALHFPKNLLGFIKYDFTVFLERCSDLCRMYMKTGAYRQEEVIEIRNSITGCHKFLEQNIRGVFDKIVIDCWIEYICRLNEIGTVTLWNNFIPCRTDFERVIFSRLSEYRYNYAINQWVNILKIQEYAKTKTEFIFGTPVKNLTEAATKANYFDLMFNVAANEMGYDISDIADNKVYSLGRTPNSPFIMSNVSREIVRSMFSDLKYLDDAKHNPKKGDFIADQTAMDAFSAIKAFIPSENDLALGTMIKAMHEVPQKVYMPTGFKAVIDLELDAIIDSNAVLQRCGRCREFYLKCDEYDYDYCDRVNREGKSCREIMDANGAYLGGSKKKIDAGLLSLRCDQLYREMSARVNIDITQRDFSDWYQYMMLIRENVLSGEATAEDFENFVEYSRSITFLSQSNKEKADGEANSVNSKKTQVDANGREVKPFVFEKIDRKSLDEHQDEIYPDSYSQGGIFVKKRNRPEKMREPETRYVYPPQQAAPPAKVIRGTAFQSQNYENEFNNYVTIPYGEEEAAPVPTERVTGNTSFADTISSSVPREEDDIKIYRAKDEKPEPKVEFVKLFEPGNDVKRRSADPDEKMTPEANRLQLQPSPRIQPLPKLQVPPKQEEFEEDTAFGDFLQRNAAAEREQERLRKEKEAWERGQEQERLRKEKEEREYEQEQERLRNERAQANKPETKISYAANAYKNTGSSRINTNAGNNESAIAKPKVSQPRIYEDTEETTAPDFSEALLKGIERRDGFDENEIPTDADGVPLSHKTKRVMDAIFKPSKPSLFININKDE